MLIIEGVFLLLGIIAWFLHDDTSAVFWVLAALVTVFAAKVFGG